MNKDRIVEKVELYVVSLWLLFLLIFVLTFDLSACMGLEFSAVAIWMLFKTNVVPIIALLFLFVGFVFYGRFNFRLSGSASIPVEVFEIDDANYEQLTFLTTCIIPLISFDLKSVQGSIALTILLVIIGVIYVKTDKFYANPTLAVLGFRLYSAKITRRTGEVVGVTLISKDRIKNGDMIRYIELDSRIYYAKEGA